MGLLLFSVAAFQAAAAFLRLESYLRSAARRGVTARHATIDGGYLFGPAAVLTLLGKWLRPYPAAATSGGPADDFFSRRAAWADFCALSPLPGHGASPPGSEHFPSADLDAAPLAEGDGWAIPAPGESQVPLSEETFWVHLEEAMQATAGTGLDITPEGPLLSYLRATIRPGSAMDEHNMEERALALLRPHLYNIAQAEARQTGDAEAEAWVDIGFQSGHLALTQPGYHLLL